MTYDDLFQAEILKLVDARIAFLTDSLVSLALQPLTTAQLAVVAGQISALRDILPDILAEASDNIKR